jgi:hypothetical protein
MAQVVDGHGGERARDTLAGREEHVHLARMRSGRDLVGGGYQLVGVLPARRQHRYHL